MRGASPMEHGAADFPQVSDEEMSLQQWALHTATANSFVSVLARKRPDHRPQHHLQGCKIHDPQGYNKAFIAWGGVPYECLLQLQEA